MPPEPARSFQSPVGWPSARMPPLRFEDPEIRLDSKRAFSTTALVVEQTGDRVLDVTVEAGVVAGIPFEKLTGQIMRRGDRLLLGRKRLLSIHTCRAFIKSNLARHQVVL